MQPGHDARNSFPDFRSTWLHDNVQVQQLQLHLQVQVNSSSKWTDIWWPGMLKLEMFEACHMSRCKLCCS